MPYSLVHCEPKVTRQPRLEAHNLGKTRPPTAVTRAEFDNRPVLVIEDRREAVDERIDAFRATARRGRPGCESVHIVMQGPPRFDGPDAWSIERVDAWINRSIDWVYDQVGDENVRCATVHLDESSPHLHVEIAPFVPDGKGGEKLSWEHRQKAMGGGARYRRTQMSAIQTSYWKAVRGLGLERGVPGRPAGEDPDREKGAKERVEDMQRKGLEDAARLRSANRSADVIRKTADAEIARANGRTRTLARFVQERLERGRGRTDDARR